MNRAFILFLALFVSITRVAPAQGPPEGLLVDIALEPGTLGDVTDIVRRATCANIVFMDKMKFVMKAVWEAVSVHHPKVLIQAHMYERKRPKGVGWIRKIQ